MKQASIPPSRAAAPALRALVLAALPLAAMGQGSSTTAIPDCVLQCRPWFIEQVTTDCETDCLADEVEVEVLIAAAAGEPYVPRFSLPDCGGSGPCPYGAETFTYATGDVVHVGAGLWSTTSGSWTHSPAAVVHADFFVAPVGSVVGATDMDQLPWQLLPAAHFDPFDGFWRTAWDTSAFDDPAGYFLRVDMLDAMLGPINAYTLGVDQTSCGFHTYGELAGGANTLELSALGLPCPGKAADLITKGTFASEVYTSVALGGDYQSLFFGTVFVDLSAQVLVLKTPASSGVAHQAVAFPATPGLTGTSIYLQSLAFDSTAPLGVAFSNALRIDFCACP